MRHLLKIIVISSLLSAQGALACSFSGSDLFKPTLKQWEQHPGPAQKGEKGDYWEQVPAPIVRVSGITRGSSAPGSSCSDAGTLSLEISLPKESTYSIEEFGIYFRVKNGVLPDAIFPDLPVVGAIENGKSNILFAWLDGHPSHQIALDLEIEVFLVTNGLNVGPSSVFTVKAGKG
ncbi:hypothetical protein [Microbulbifer sp. SSSA005]|uniref:hypothetical protein n=1 Tax=Microbulbifer sp. SSSA005 TaxID=3243378 RepID=UPI0040398C65